MSNPRPSVDRSVEKIDQAKPHHIDIYERNVWINNDGDSAGLDDSSMDNFMQAPDAWPDPPKVKNSPG